MAYQALYRKYRPNSFEDFVDQDSIKRILINSIKNNKISHAYLFSGPRGIGKTSMAKIFAKAINCKDFLSNDDVCNKCDNCVDANSNSVDIVEIDAASNNGVDQIRDLKNKISIVPSLLKYKVYIIDEVHMLTNSAFNALLKTLEEPPEYIVFILATTEFYEVPETIVSRCQCFSFNRISLKSMENRLRHIADLENIDITDDAITEIAHFANGGLRDAIGMLDKLRSFTTDKIDVEVFKNINGMISQEEIVSFYNDLFQSNILNILGMINKISEQGYDFKNFIERVMILTRDKIIDYYVKNSDINGDIHQNINLVSTLNDILNRLKDAINPMIVVQVYILKYIENSKSNTINQPVLEENDRLIQSIDNKKIISQEIINKPLVNKSDEYIHKNKDVDKNNAQSKFSYLVNEENKGVRINNAMATANINFKKELAKVWSSLNEYFLDEHDGKIAQLLFDTEPMVVGTKYMILTTVSEGIIDNIYLNLSQVESFISKIYHPISVVLLLNFEFESVKKKYIEDRNNNIIYEEKEEYGKLIIEQSNLANKAIDLFGKDLVDIE